MEESPDQEGENGEDVSEADSARSSPPELPPSGDSRTAGCLESPKPLFGALDILSEQLSSTLREEMGRMRWPDGA